MSAPWVCGDCLRDPPLLAQTRAVFVYGFPLDKASVIAMKTISAYLQEHPELERVRMVCFDNHTKRFYDEALADLSV